MKYHLINSRSSKLLLLSFENLLFVLIQIAALNSRALISHLSDLTTDLTALIAIIF